jgi:menaquinone-9 beta-reductase
MSEPVARPPADCEVLVVGAGPAGSAAARWLALAGVDVLQIDQQPPGRDKVCGDGLIPDSHQALARLGLLDAVMARAQRAGFVGCVGPRGGRVEVPGSLAVLPRRELDLLLLQAAQQAGARFLAPARFEAPLEDAQGRVVGSRVKTGDELHEIRARWVLLATGAVPKALTAAGMCERHTPSGVALRGYVRAPSMVGQIKSLDVVWSRAVRPGYGWIFPAPDDCFNIGVGVTDSHHAQGGQGGKGVKKELNLRAIFDAFVAHYEPAARLMREGELIGELKGAPLRFSLDGARWSRPGLMVVGEAAGSTYSFTGEGIGKAMQTGMLAADAVLAHRQDDAAARAQYEQGLRDLKPKFDLYARANRVNTMPWLADLLIWRAQKSPAIVRRMAGVLNETSNPASLISLRGITRLFLE